MVSLVSHPIIAKLENTDTVVHVSKAPYVWHFSLWSRCLKILEIRQAGSQLIYLDVTAGQTCIQQQLGL